jgi:predicted PurR-regulated permease PerM
MQWQKWLVILVAGLVLYWSRRVLPPFVVAGLVAYVLSPLVEWLMGRGLPRAGAASAVFLAILAPLVIGTVLLWPMLTGETRELLRNGPDLIETVLLQAMGGQPIAMFGEEVAPRAVAVRVTDSLREALGRPTDALHAAEQLVEAVLQVVLTLLAIFYLLLDGWRLGRFVLRFVPPEHRGHVEAIAPRIHRVLGRYLGGQALLIGLMSAVTFVVLEFVFHLRFALPIAVATGFLEVIPVVGPIAAGAIACVVALSQHGLQSALWVALAFLVLRQVEDQFVMPQVVGRVVHLHPLITIFAVLAGGTIAGVLGMILAVPVAASVKVVLDYAYPDEGLTMKDEG